MPRSRLSAADLSGSEFAAGAGPLFVDCASDCIPDVAVQSDAARWYAVRAAHRQVVGTDRGGEVCRGCAVRMIGAFCPIERNPKVGTAGAAGDAVGTHGESAK